MSDLYDPASPLDVPRATASIITELRYVTHGLRETDALRHLKPCDTTDTSRHAHELLANARRGDWASVETYATQLHTELGIAGWSAIWEAVTQELLAACEAARTAAEPIGLTETWEPDYSAGDSIADDEIADSLPPPPVPPKQGRQRKRSADKSRQSEPVASAASKTAKTAAPASETRGDLEKMLPPHPTRDEQLVTTNQHLAALKEGAFQRLDALIEHIKTRKEEETVNGRADAIPPPLAAPEQHTMESASIFYLGNSAYQLGPTGEPQTVTESMNRVLRAFVGHPALSQATIARKAQIDDDGVPRLMKSLEKLFGKAAIKRPGGRAKGGYRITVIDHRKPPESAANA